MISVLDGQLGAPDAPGKNPASQSALVLVLAVVGCTPPIWRSIVVLETMWLNQLHDTIQTLFDWFDYQTHEFVVEGTRYGNPFNRDEIVVQDDRDVRLADLHLGTHERMLYRYHFGQTWEVEIRLEKTTPVEKGVMYPKCLAGERAGPLEDCGGLEAYHEMVACLKAPNTAEAQDWVAWVDPDFDSEKCDLAHINKLLKLWKKGEAKGESSGS